MNQQNDSHMGMQDPNKDATRLSGPDDACHAPSDCALGHTYGVHFDPNHPGEYNVIRGEVGVLPQQDSISVRVEGAIGMARTAIDQTEEILDRLRPAKEQPPCGTKEPVSTNPADLQSTTIVLNGNLQHVLKNISLIKELL